MFLTIWRHGEAGSAVTDRMRELTARGIDDVGFGCQQFHAHCEARGVPHPQVLLYSEWVRARQTVEIIARAYNHAELEACAALIPGSRPAQVDTALQDRAALGSGAGHLLLVSHQPLVSTLIDHYLGDAGKVPPLMPGGVALLEMDVVAAGCGQLLFSAQPPNFEVDQ